MEQEQKHSLPNFYSVTPSYIRYDRKLTNFAKVLYGELVALANINGYCFAYNKYFEVAFGVSESTIQRGLKKLEDRGYIFIDIQRNPDTNQVIIRKIYIVLEDNTPPNKNDRTPLNKNDRVTRVNAFNYNNNTSVNTNVNTKGFNSYYKNKPKDIDIDWLEDYINNIPE